MALENVPGQKRAVMLLRGAVRTGAIAHAYLFVGPGGVGRLALARRFASVLLCREGEQERCGACRSCRAFDASNHPDYREIGVPEGKQDLPIDTIRSVEHDASLKPALAPRRVFVMREAERMTLEAANCFLKTLEEPPGNCCFILIATTLRDLPQTVVSRCQVVRFSALPPRQVEEELRDGGLSDEDAWWLARRSWGSPGRARAFRDVGLHEFNRRLAEELFALDAGRNFRLSDWLCEMAPESPGSRAEARVALQELLECVVVFYRDLAAAAVAPGEVELFNSTLKERFEQFAAGLPLDLIIECAERAIEAIEHIGANANRRLALDDLFSHLAAAGANPPPESR